MKYKKKKKKTQIIPQCFYGCQCNPKRIAMTISQFISFLAGFFHKINWIILYSLLNFFNNAVNQFFNLKVFSKIFLTPHIPFNF